MDGKNSRRLIGRAKAADLRPVIPTSFDYLTRPELIEQWCSEKGIPAFGLRGPSAMATVWVFWSNLWLCFPDGQVRRQGGVGN